MGEPVKATSVPDTDTPAHNRLCPLEAAAGWLVPGLGHILLGQRVRGLILMVSILGLWLGGLVIGGITCVNSRDHTAWFAGQALVGPTIAVDFWRAAVTGGSIAPVPRQNPAYEPSYGRTNEQGILYTALAGLLNLLAIIDVVYCDPDRRRPPRPASEAPPGELSEPTTPQF
jgi:hypothetical protein